jgi:predicted aspartyl protease
MRLLLAATLVAVTTVGAQTARTLPAGERALADSLLRNRLYLDLERWTQRPVIRGTHDAALYAGIISNRRNRNTDAIRFLRPLLDDRALASDTVKRHHLLTTLGDCYTKLYQYGEASRMSVLAEQESAVGASPEVRASLRRNTQFHKLLATAPPQVVVAPRAQVPLRRGTLGVMELPVTIGADSSWWIFDTGANFSTIAESEAAKWGLTLSPDTASVSGVTGLRVKLRTAVIPLARLGQIEVRNMIVLVLPDSALYVAQLKHQITAILGFPVIEAMKVVTIAPEKLIVMDPPAGGAETDLMLEQLTPLVAATVEGRTDLYHLDTGANRTAFSVRFRDAHAGLVNGLAPESRAMNGAGGARSLLAHTVPLIAFSLGAHAVILRNVEVHAEQSAAVFENFFGNVGQDAFEGAALTLDFLRMRLIVSR